MLCTVSKYLLCAGLAAAAVCGVQAQVIYRCGPNGNQYSQQACEGGRIVDVADTRSSAQAAQARQAVGEQRKLAMQMAKERREEERAHPPASAGNLGNRAVADQLLPTVKPKQASSKKRAGKSSAQVAEGQEFAAIDPASLKKKKDKKRAAAQD